VSLFFFFVPAHSRILRSSCASASVKCFDDRTGGWLCDLELAFLFRSEKRRFCPTKVLQRALTVAFRLRGRFLGAKLKLEIDNP